MICELMLDELLGHVLGPEAATVNICSARTCSRRRRRRRRAQKVECWLEPVSGRWISPVGRHHGELCCRSKVGR